MSSGLISIAVTGINAAQMGLMVTGNNISNASTDGYVLQRIVQASNPTVMTGAGGLGEGVHVETVQRMYSQALNTQVLNAQSSVSSLDTYYSQVSQIDNMLGDPSAGLTPSVQSFFNAIQAVSSSPSSSAARQSLVSSAQSMVSSFQSVYSRLSELNAGVNSQIGSVVQSINTYANQIAELNQSIVSTNALNGQPANDLLDKRDQLVSELNKLVKVNVTAGDSGSYNVFIGTGQQLVVGSRVNQMTAIASSSDLSRIVVGLSGTSGNVQELPESLINGGQLGGLMSFRSQSLDAAYNQVGMIAASVAQTYNAQNALGQDQLGNVAGSAGFVANFFSVSQPTVMANSANAAGGPTVSASFDTPTPYNGTSFYTNLTASDYKLSYDGSNFKLTRLSDNTSWSGASVSAINTALASTPQGFTLSESATNYTAGDSFLIQPTRFAAQQFSVNSSVAADARLIAAASPARVAGAATNTGSGSVSNVTVGPGYSAISLPMSLTYDGTGFTGFPAGATVTVGSGTPQTIAATTDSVPYTSGAKITISMNPASTPYEMSLSISGVPKTNDVFTVSSNTGGVEDSGNIVRLGKLQTQSTMLGGTSSFLSSYAAFVNTVGNDTSSAKTASSAQTTLLSQATSARDAVSGVNLDEEAAKLIQYQQAYQASAKVLEIASKIFDTLLAL